MYQDMPLRPTTVRFAHDTMELVQKAADECGVSMAQFVREAAIIRATFILPEEASKAAWIIQRPHPDKTRPEKR